MGDDLLTWAAGLGSVAAAAFVKGTIGSASR